MSTPARNPWEQLAAAGLSAQTGRKVEDYYRAWDAGRRLSDPPAGRPAIPSAVRRAVRADGRCVYCGAPDAAEIDHIQPWARGGTHDVSNLVPACVDCNSSKSDRLLTEWDAARVRHGIAASTKIAEVYKRLTESARRRVT